MKLTIEVVNGQLKINGPLHDLPLCERMLDDAKQALKNAKPVARGIEIPTPGQVMALTKDANRR